MGEVVVQPQGKGEAVQGGQLGEGGGQEHQGGLASGGREDGLLEMIDEMEGVVALFCDQVFLGAVARAEDPLAVVAVAKQAEENALGGEDIKAVGGPLKPPSLGEFDDVVVDSVGCAGRAGEGPGLKMSVVGGHDLADGAHILVVDFGGVGAEANFEHRACGALDESPAPPAGEPLIKGLTRGEAVDLRALSPAAGGEEERQEQEES